MTPKPIAQMTDEEFIASIAQIFDEPDELAQTAMWTAYRIEASRRKRTREFDRTYSVLKRICERTEGGASPRPGGTAAPDFEMRFGFPLEMNSRGVPLCTSKNFADILRNDPDFAGIHYNMLDHSLYNGAEKWTDADDSRLRSTIESRYKIYSVLKLLDALNEVSQERRKHPVHDMIDGIKWDGRSRIYTMLNKWLKCDDTEYTREVSRLIFAGGINRIYNPGCKFDSVPVLIGPNQGEGKSTFVRWLAMDDKYFTEITSIDGKEGVENLEGKWICEFGELLALTRAKEQEAIKSYISRQADHYRQAYCRNTVDRQRQCIFIGTTNRIEFIADKTGGRRFLPVLVKSRGSDLYGHAQEVKEDIRQCWAEARYLFGRGQLPGVERAELAEQIRAAQAEASEEDYRVADIAKFLQSQPIGGRVCVKMLWIHALGMPEDRPIPYQDSRAIGAIMQKMPGWRRKGNAFIPGYGYPKVWERIAPGRE